MGASGEKFHRNCEKAGKKSFEDFISVHFVNLQFIFSGSHKKFEV